MEIRQQNRMMQGSGSASGQLAIVFEVAGLGRTLKKGSTPITREVYVKVYKGMTQGGWRFESGHSRYAHPILNDSYISFPDHNTIEIRASGENSAHNLAAKLGLKESHRD